MFKNFMKINKLALVFMMAIGSVVSAFAENKITLGDGGTISLKPGGTKVVAVNFQNDNEFGALQFDMEFTSDKVGIVEGSLVVNDERASRELFMSTLYHMENGKWRLSVLSRPSAINFISGHEGVLAYFTIKAADDFTKDDGARVYFSTSSGGDGENSFVINTPKFQAITPLVGSFSLGETAFSIKPGGTHKVDVMLNNEVQFNGLQTDIALPEGLTIENDKGTYNFEYSDRLSNNFMISSALQKNGKVRVMLSSLPVDEIKGKEGTLFSFNVVADKNFVSDENSVISFSNTIATADAGVVEYSLETENAVAKVTSLKGANDAAYARLVEEVATLQKTLDDAKAKVAEECKDVAENYAEAVEAIQKQIDAIKADLDSKNENCDLTAESALDAEAVKAVKEAVEKYVAEAQAAQADVVKKAANEAAYKRLSEELAAVQARFEEVKGIIDEKYSNVAGQFVGVEMTIQLEINRVSKELKAQYENIELTEESQLDVQVLKDTIEQLLDDAKKASETAGINGILNGADGAECIGVYTLDGTEVNAPVKGQTYVVRYADGKTMKVFIR